MDGGSELSYGKSSVGEEDSNGDIERWTAMNDDRESTSNALRDRIGAAFGRERDPLSVYESTFEALEVDPFEVFLRCGLEPDNPAPRTRQAYQQLIDEWTSHMASLGRHPACPSEDHILRYVENCLTTRELKPVTLRTRLHRLNRVYRYWQADSVFPHDSRYNPFQYVFATTDLSQPPSKDPPRISPSRLGEIVRTITDVRDRLIVVLQLKLGLRAGEVSNLRLENLAVDHEELNTAYPEIGSNPAVENLSRTVFIPSRYEEQGNKSHRARLLPLDDEVYQSVVQHLLVRPDTGNQWVFQSHTTASKITPEAINRVWTSVFRPAYDETENHRAVTSHFGRHRFSTYWQVECEIPRELVQYMRGDRIEGADPNRETIDSYIHTYYTDIEQIYLENIYSLDISTEFAL